MDVTNDRTEQLVRQTLSAVADQVRAPETEHDEVQTDDRSVTSRPTVTALRRTHRRNRRLVIIAACLVLALVAGGVALLTQRAESPKVSVSPAAEQPSDTDMSQPYGLPATDAEITSLLPMPTFFEQFYNGTYAGASAQLTVSIQVVPDVLQKGVESLSGCTGQEPTVEVNGHNGCTTSTVTQVTTQFVSWVEDSSTVIGLQSSTLSSDQLVEVANGVKRDGSRVSLDPVPDGLQPSGTHIDPNADHPGYDYVNFNHNDCDYYLSREVSTTLPTGSSPVTINGYPGAVIGDNTIAWLVRGSLMTLNIGTIQGPGDPVVIQPVGPQPVAPSCDLQATATTIRYITEADWKQRVGDHSSDTSTSGAPSTTTSPAASDSSQPQYTGDEAQIADVFRTFISGSDIDTLVSLLEDGVALRETLSKEPTGKTGTPSARIDSVTLVDDTHALVTYSILLNGQLSLPNQHGTAVKIDGTWRVSRDTYCALVAQGGIQCPPK